jgi:hypothetical protein
LHQNRNDATAGREDRVRVRCNETCCLSPHAVHVVGRPTLVELHVCPIGPSELSKLLPECADAGLDFGIPFGVRHQQSYAPYPLALLPARGERPRGHAAEQRDELASS